MEQFTSFYTQLTFGWSIQTILKPYVTANPLSTTPVTELGKFTIYKCAQIAAPWIITCATRISLKARCAVVVNWSKFAFRFRLQSILWPETSHVGWGINVIVYFPYILFYMGITHWVTKTMTTYSKLVKDTLWEPNVLELLTRYIKDIVHTSALSSYCKCFK